MYGYLQTNTIKKKKSKKALEPKNKKLKS